MLAFIGYSFYEFLVTFANYTMAFPFVVDFFKSIGIDIPFLNDQRIEPNNYNYWYNVRAAFDGQMADKLISLFVKYEYRSRTICYSYPLY